MSKKMIEDRKKFQKYIIVGETRIQALNFIIHNGLLPKEVRINPDPIYLDGISDMVVYLLPGWERKRGAKMLKRKIDEAYLVNVKTIVVTDDEDGVEDV